MTERVQVGGIQVAKNLYDFVNNEAIPGTGIDADKFWAEFDKIVNELAPRNRELLAKRDAIQEKMDSWNRDHKGQKLDMAEYKSFLKDIGYCLSVTSDMCFEIDKTFREQGIEIPFPQRDLNLRDMSRLEAMIDKAVTARGDAQ